jgi:hypothetical protein
MPFVFVSAPPQIHGHGVTMGAFRVHAVLASYHIIGLQVIENLLK